jgi:hypothetical protein
MSKNIPSKVLSLMLVCLFSFVAVSRAWTQETRSNVGTHALSPARHAERQIWIGGISPVMQRHRKLDNPSDWMAMFDVNAPWPVASAHMAYFKMPSQAIEMSTDEEMHIILDGLRRRHIGLAVEMGLLLDGPNGCGHGLEGMGALHEPDNVIKRIKALGGTIDAVAMDEPVIFGRLKMKGERDNTPGCQYPVATMVDQVAPKIEQLREAFPNIKVGDIEAIGGGASGARGMEDILAFETQLHQRTHDFAPAFVHADMQWNDVGVIQQADRLSRRMHALGIRVGVICDGGGPTIKDSNAWVDNAVQRCQTLSADPNFAPDDLLAQTWETLPTKMLPEGAPGTMTGEAKRLLALP